MASIHDVNLDMQFEQGSAANTEVLNAVLSFEVHFTSTEVELNLKYHLQAALVERDQGDDYLVYRPNGRRIRIDLKRDDFIGWLGSEHFRPGEQRVHEFTFKRKLGERLTTSSGSVWEVDPSIAEAAREEFDRALHDEEYEAFITIRSELAPAETWSNRVRRDLW